MGSSFTDAEKERLRQIHEEYDRSLSPYANKNKDAQREFPSMYDGDVLRSQYAIDIDKIIHSPLYNRGSDKTQVFSFFRNDDITRRISHMQLVSRISRTIGKVLKLNLDLIEAIAIGHDIGHTPFGHKGEDFLNELYHEHTGRYFTHNVHSVRILRKITKCNLTLFTLDGILCHCGEKVVENYEPGSVSSFTEFDALVERCYKEKDAVRSLRPSTLEGCVVRISDIIAYLGKDRQDARKTKLFKANQQQTELGKNADIITNITMDIIKNSLDQPYLSVSKTVSEAMEKVRKENNELIYQHAEVIEPYYDVVKPMMKALYYKFKDDLLKENRRSPIYIHYLDSPIWKNLYQPFSKTDRDIEKDRPGPDDTVVDFIASMTDDYFVDVFATLFPDDPLNQDIKYVEYFDERYLDSSI